MNYSDTETHKIISKLNQLVCVLEEKKDTQMQTLLGEKGISWLMLTKINEYSWL